MRPERMSLGEQSSEQFICSLWGVAPLRAPETKCGTDRQNVLSSFRGGVGGERSYTKYAIFECYYVKYVKICVLEVRDICGCSGGKSKEKLEDCTLNRETREALTKKVT